MTLFPSYMPGFVDFDDPVGVFSFPGFGLGHDDAVVGSAQVQWPEKFSANARFDTTTMVNPVVGEIGSDAFWRGMVRLFQECSPENLDQLSLEGSNSNAPTDHSAAG